MATFTLTGDFEALAAPSKRRVTMVEIKPTLVIRDPTTNVVYEPRTRVRIPDAGNFSVELPSDATPGGYGFIVNALQVGLSWYVPVQATGATVDLSDFTGTAPGFPSSGDTASVSAAAAAASATAAASSASAAAAVGSTNDGIIASRLNDSTSTTRAALASKVFDVVNVKDPTYGATGNGTNNTTALAAAITGAKAKARVISGTGRTGLPTIYLPRGDYRITASLMLEHINGLRIQGDAKGGTVLRVDTGIDLFNVGRSSDLTFSDLTLSCGDHNPGGAATSGLVQNSCGVYIHERDDDADTTGNTTGIRFERVQFAGFHKAIRCVGNQMGDNVTFTDCTWRDNFNDFDYANGQAVNHRIIGGEMVSWVYATEAAYNARLTGWSSGAYPVSRPTTQRIDPTNGASAIQAVTVRDGAYLRVVAGMEPRVYNCSFIGVKTVLLYGAFSNVLATDVAAYGTTENLLHAAFTDCTFEVRTEDTIKDKWGASRTALLRFEKPFPETDNIVLTTTVVFDRVRVTVAPTNAVPIFHVINGVSVIVRDTKVAFNGTRPTLVSMLAGILSTLALPGRFRSVNSTILTNVNVGQNPDGSAFDPTTVPRLRHDVQQESPLKLGARLDPAPAPNAARQTLVPTVPYPVKRVHFTEVDDVVFGSVSTPVNTERALPVGVGAFILRAGIDLTGKWFGTDDDLVIEVRQSDGTVLATIRGDWTVTTGGAVTAVAGGIALDNHRNAFADIRQPVLSTGYVIIKCTTATGAAYYGQVWVEYI